MKKIIIFIIAVLIKIFNYYIYLDVPFFSSSLNFIVIFILFWLFFNLFFKNNFYIIFILSVITFYFTLKYYNVDFRNNDKAILSIDKHFVNTIDTLHINNYCNTYLINKIGPLTYSKERIFISLEQSKKNNTSNNITWLYTRNNEIIKIDRGNKIMNIKKSTSPLRDNIYIEGECDCFVKNFIE